MHDIATYNGVINDWSRKVMASKAFLLRYIMPIQYIMSCKYYCIDETMIIVTKK